MPLSAYRPHALILRPLHAILIAGAAPLFAGALFSDIAYASSPQTQWANFASWLIVGALVLTGLALLWSVLGILTSAGRTMGAMLVLAFLASSLVIGFVNALDHARDAWAIMPGSLILSIVDTATAFAAVWAAFSAPRHEVAR